MPSNKNCCPPVITGHLSWAESLAASSASLRPDSFLRGIINEDPKRWRGQTMIWAAKLPGKCGNLVSRIGINGCDLSPDHLQSSGAETEQFLEKTRTRVGPAESVIKTLFMVVTVGQMSRKGVNEISRTFSQYTENEPTRTFGFFKVPILPLSHLWIHQDTIIFRHLNKTFTNANGQFCWQRSSKQTACQCHCR